MQSTKLWACYKTTRDIQACEQKNGRVILVPMEKPCGSVLLKIKHLEHIESFSAIVQTRETTQ